MPSLAPPRPLARRWIFPPAPDAAVVESLAAELRLPPPLCRLLALRGYGEGRAAREFLRPHPGQIHPPQLLAGMGDAVARLRRAVLAGETVLVHGDYDVDGICATALFTRALRAMGARAVPFVPHRLEDGYDLTDAGIRAAAAAGATLILTGDCGIVAHEAVLRARRAGIDVIVTDHHTPGPTLPDCVAVVNPNRADCGYPDKGLAGVGVAYKLCCALAAEVGYPQERLHGYLDLVALATVADLAPLVGENRALVRWGLRVLAQTPNPGLRALLRSCGLADRGEISAAQVGFVLAPRINAVGRMGEALRGVDLLLTDDPAEAEEIAATLEAENRSRQAVDVQTLGEVMRVLDRVYDPDRDRGVVLASDGWHPGVIGIVASRVVERIHRPTVLIALDGSGEGKGSARSISAFHLYDAMRHCAEHLTRFGGHRYAAGCSIRRERVDGFRHAFDARARAVLEDDDLVPEVRIDLELRLPEAGEELFRVLRHAGPFGMGNPTPVFAARGVGITGYPKVVGQGHLKLTLASEGASLEAIGFGMGDRLADPELGRGRLDVAFKLEENTWNGRSRLQAKLVDLRPGSSG
ncbi:MAG TPA: single-stranded-DNA-specific exonuclease RecJ [Longimicrobiaceae bacterium]|nr:single-stranded-DNA-specific exonuclease RecJ [Longimicrobiaceae bacterium]